MDDPNVELDEAGDDDGSTVEVEGGDADVDQVNPEEEEEIPPEVQRRVHALKNVQMDIVKLESEFYREMHEVECKYLPLYQPHFEKRRQITAGEYEPTDKECEPLHSDVEGVVEAVAKVNLGGDDANDGREKVKGIPDFWLKIFKNVDMLQDMIEIQDEPILKHLVDITVEMDAKPMGFKLHFHFSPNEFFSNPVLTKSYTMKCEPEPEDPFQFEGPEIVSCTGCQIDWAKGKNATVKLVRKKQKNRQRGQTRTVQRTVNADSFFNFFNPPEVPDDGETELDEQTQIKLTTDFEIGQYIRERIIPHAVLYYTGEALDDEYEEEEEEDEEGLEDEDEDEDEGDNAPATPRQPKVRSVAPSAKKSAQDCNQQ